MDSFKIQALIGAGVGSIALALGSLPLTSGLAATVISASAFAAVAFLAQSQRFDEDKRLVYRPVYVRGGNVQRRVMSKDR